MANRQSLLLTGLLLPLLVSCTLQLPYLDKTGAQQPRAKERSPELIREFEQQIASQLLADLPVISPITTSVEAKRSIEALRQLLYQSGINRNLLTKAQQQQFKALEHQLRRLEGDLPFWSQKNHLNDIAVLLVGTSEPGEALKRVERNLSEQQQSGIQLPAILAAAGVSSARQLEKVDTTTLIERLGNQSEISKPDQNWMSNRLGHYFYPQELHAVKAGLSDMMDKQSKSDAASFYQNDIYDIRTEAHPEQLALDLLSLHIEEALRSADYTRSVDIRGMPSGLLGSYAIIGDTIVFDFSRVLERPAFELQTLAYSAAAEFLSGQPWSFRWRKVLAMTDALALNQQLEADGYFMGREALLGLEIRRELFVHFALLEVRLAMGEINMQEARLYLQSVMPYKAEQIDALLIELLASDGSFAAAVLLAEHLPKEASQQGRSQRQESADPLHLKKLLAEALQTEDLMQ